jgi:hypothetical protein
MKEDEIVYPNLLPSIHLSLSGFLGLILKGINYKIELQ